LPAARRTAGAGHGKIRLARVRGAGRSCGGRDATPWPAAFDRICGWYQAQIERLHDDAEVRQADIEQLGRIAATYPTRSASSPN
jgi:hypothetical protein